MGDLKVVGQLRLQSAVTFDAQRTVPLAAAVTGITIPAGSYSFFDDGSATDFAQVFTTLIQAADPTLANVSMSVEQSTGKVSLIVGPGETVQITWTGTGTSDADVVRDWCRYPTLTTVTTGTPTLGSRTHAFGFYPSAFRTAITDLPGDLVQASQTVSDSGSAETVFFACRQQWRLTLLCRGFPYAAAANDFHALRDLMAYASKGLHWRYYRDKTNNNPYVEITEPLGYLDLILDSGSFGWSPSPHQGNYYFYWTKELAAWDA